MAFKEMNFTDQKLKELFKTIDLDDDGYIDKEEMALFLNLLLI